MLTGRNEGVVRLRSRELTVAELLAAFIVRQVIERDGVNPQWIRGLIAPIAQTLAKSR
jgi:uncharacterized membrane protein